MRAVDTLGNGLLPALLVALILLPGGRSPGAVDAASAPHKGIAAGSSSSARSSDLVPAGARAPSSVRPIIDLLADSMGLARRLTPALDDDAALTLLLEGDPSGDRVDFLIATVPDYVDSNSGWMADEIIGAMQSAMAHSDLVLDRFVLPELPHADGKDDLPASHSDTGRIHETQPGALIFRNYTDDRRRIAVLLVLETPTSGIHRQAFDHAARLVNEWFTRTKRPQPWQFQIIGPTFSGSTMSLAAAVAGLAANTGFQKIDIVTGSATAEANQKTILSACQTPTRTLVCSYQATMHTADVVKRTLAVYLRSMNPSWLPGGVALLVESNTTFGRSVSRVLEGDDPDEDPFGNGPSFKSVRTFHFPLHIAQLRNDARPSGLPNLLNLPIPSLNLGESTTASDQLPALRKALTSAVTEATVDAMLDDIRHEGIAAVGFVATDVRDILFLSREVKRAVPDVQLFYPNAHRLYLHPEFVPYTRGALVASTYPIAVANQARSIASSGDREAFQSTVAEGVFNATLVQLGEAWQLADYSTSNGGGPAPTATQPDLWVSVVGDDGFWPLARVNDMDTHHSMPAAAQAALFEPLPLPGTAQIAVFLISLFLLLHLAALFPRVRTGIHGPTASLARWSDGLSNAFRRWPVLSAWVTPAALPSARRLHGRVRVLACGHAAVVAFWAASVLWVSRTGAPVAWASAFGALLLLPVLGSVLVATRVLRLDAWTSIGRSKTRFLTRPRVSSYVEGAVAVCLGAPLVVLAVSVWSTYWQADGTSLSAWLAAERTLGGGIVSSSPATLCLLAALYVPLFWSLRRLSTFGVGYRAIVARSTALRFVLGDGATNLPHSGEIPSPGSDNPDDSLWRCAALLDKPLHRLPWGYFAAIVPVIVVAHVVLARDGWTIDGPLFSWFLRTASLVVLACTLTLLAQAAETWRALRTLLGRLKHSPLVTAFDRLNGAQLKWTVSPSAPCAQDLRWLVQLSDSLRRSIRDAALSPEDANRTCAALERLGRQEERLRNGGRTGPGDRSMLLQSPTWFHLWHMADALVDLLSSTYWKTRSAFALIEPPRQTPGTPTQVPDARSRMPMSRSELWFTRSETLVAALFAFTFRDIVARIMSGVFAAMVCLGLLTGAHLFYVFQGRPSFLTLDMAALAGGAAAAVWVLIGMERDTVLSLMWQTTPGRVTFNWVLIQRLTIYGLLPLVIVVGSLFPEIGEPILKWLEPIRKLTAI